MRENEIFNNTIKIIAAEIDKFQSLKFDTSELEKAIKVLRDGQGYLRKDKPIGIVFYGDM